MHCIELHDLTLLEPCRVNTICMPIPVFLSMFIHYISSTVNITWSPPFTLPDTNIIGYNISVAINGSNSASLFTMESHYEFILTSVTNSPCNDSYMYKGR